MPAPKHFINPHFSQHKKKTAGLSIQSLFEEIRKGNTAALSQGITLLESELPEHKEKSAGLVELCLPYSGQALRIGITGIPGAGKSTFIEALGNTILEEQSNMAILAIDPSSTLSKGSILGDKTRMEELSKKENVFIRPTPSAGSLGGVARATRETMVLCEAAGFKYVLVETVGVGQSEIDIYYLTDIFILLLIPGGGDELQGIKRGIMEMADMILVNKAEEENAARARQSVKQLENALHYIQANKYGHHPTVHAISALHQLKTKETWKNIATLAEKWKANGAFDQKRKDQDSYWFEQSLQNGIKYLIQKRKDWNLLYEALKASVKNGEIHPFNAADTMLKKITGGN